MCSTDMLRKASSSGGIGLLRRSLNQGVCSMPRVGLYKSLPSKSVWINFFTTGVGSSSSLSRTTGVSSYMVRRFKGGGGVTHIRCWFRHLISVSARVSFIR